jgi:parvulin-like peptidyl-prolyl isomerase
MERYSAMFALLAMLVAGCAPKAEKAVLKEGTPAYVLAKSFAVAIPALDPEETAIIVEAKGFTVTAAEVIQTLWDTMGTRTDRFKAFDAGQLKQLLEGAATQHGERKILFAAAAAAGTVVPDGELEKALQAQYARAGSEQAFLDALKGADISIDNVKKSIGESLLINAYLEGVVKSGSEVTEEDLRSTYEREKTGDRTATVRHILVLTQGKSEAEKAEARKTIEGLLVRARAGEDFADLAKQYTEDPGSKENGGLYEDFPRGQMVKPFEDASFSVPVGRISDVVETTYGYHIIKVIDRKKETRPFEEVRGEIEARLKEQKEGSLVRDHVKALKDEAGFKLIGL